VLPVPEDAVVVVVVVVVVGGVALREDEDALSPEALVATTENEYVVPRVKPVITHVTAVVVVQPNPLGDEETV
jgi:hypothetical protein